MKLKLTLDEAKKKIQEYMALNEGCGPCVVRVMREAYGFQNDDAVWASEAFRGGIAGLQDGPCGAVSGTALALGLRHRCSDQDPAKVGAAVQTVMAETAVIVQGFKEKFGSMTCWGLLGIKIESEEDLEKAKQSGVLDDKCPVYIEYVIEKLYELEDKRP